MSNIISKAGSFKKIKALLKVDESRLDKYLRFYAGEVLYEQSSEYPNKDFLTDTDREMLERYRRVFSMFKVGRTDEIIRSIICAEYKIEWRQARNIVNDAYYIFGVIGNADREGKKRVSIEYYRSLANLCAKNRDYENAGKLWEKADKLEGLFDLEASGLNPEDFKHAPTFVFTDNINILNQRQKALDLDE
ncbi:hypothetical protein [Aquirufa nivalisilvae]